MYLAVKGNEVITVYASTAEFEDSVIEITGWHKAAVRRVRELEKLTGGRL